MSESFSYSFPAIRGIQAGREYYVSMCPLRLLTKIFLYDEEELVPELRAQRSLNRIRVPEIARYIVENQSSYVFSAITASIAGEVKFEPNAGADPKHFRMGTLQVSMDARFIVNDGQHRRAAITQALQTHPQLGDETIAVVFFVDRGLKRCQQMFADLNRYAVKPSASLGLLYDHRNVTAQLAKDISSACLVFRGMIETERSNLAQRSRKLFTLSALHSATLEMFPEKELANLSDTTKWCVEFWDEVGSHIPEWRLVRESKLSAGEVRQTFIHSHAIVLHALGRVARRFVGMPRKEYARKLTGLEKIDWSRKNSEAWEGRAMLGGTVAKSSQNVALTSNYIKKAIGIKLTPEEEQIELALNGGRNSRQTRTK